MSCLDFKLQIEGAYDDIPLLQLDAFWVDCERKTNFMAHTFAEVRSESLLLAVGELWAPAIDMFPLLMISHLRGVYLERRAQLRASAHARAVNGWRAGVALDA